VVIGMPSPTFGEPKLAKAGCKRISIGLAFSHLAFGALMSAAREILDCGTFTFAKAAAGFAKLDGIFVRYQEND